MVILIAVILALGLLYFWLLGHWFARVLVFLLFAAAFGAVGTTLEPRGEPAAAMIGVMLGVALAWPAASLPIYYWRRRIMAQGY